MDIAGRRVSGLLLQNPSLRGAFPEPSCNPELPDRPGRLSSVLYCKFQIFYLYLELLLLLPTLTLSWSPLLFTDWCMACRASNQDRAERNGTEEEQKGPATTVVVTAAAAAAAASSTTIMLSTKRSSLSMLPTPSRGSSSSPVSSSSSRHSFDGLIMNRNRNKNGAAVAWKRMFLLVCFLMISYNGLHFFHKVDPSRAYYYLQQITDGGMTDHQQAFDGGGSSSSGRLLRYSSTAIMTDIPEDDVQDEDLYGDGNNRLSSLSSIIQKKYKNKNNRG